MTAPAKRPQRGGVPRTLERVTRPDGSEWRQQSRWPPKVYRENTPAGPVVLVLRTHDPEKARRIAEVRWSALYPHLPLPAGELEWRRQEGAAWAQGGRGTPDFRLGPSTGTETRSFPVVAFKPPAVRS